MARGDQLARQWKIIQTLISSRIGKSAADLADEIECHPRTLYRDLEALQLAGFPIYDEKVEGKKLWSLLDTVRHHIPVPFTLPELIALYFSTDMLKIFKDTVFYDSLESLSQKIRTTLPPHSLDYINNLKQTIQIGIKPYKDYGRFREIINRVNDACAGRRSVEMIYYTMSRRKESKRRVDPYRIWFFRGSFYLIGFCHLRKEIRVFTVDRIKMLHLTEEKFEIPEDFRFEEFIGRSFGVFQGEPVHVRVRFSPDVAGYIKEKIWLSNQDIEALDDGSIIFEADVSGTDEIRFWIMSWGSKAEVIEPEALRQEIQTEAEAVLDRYSRGVMSYEEPLKETAERIPDGGHIS